MYIFLIIQICWWFSACLILILSGTYNLLLNTDSVYDKFISYLRQYSHRRHVRNCWIIYEILYEMHIIMIYFRSELRLPVFSIRALTTTKPKPKAKFFTSSKLLFHLLKNHHLNNSYAFLRHLLQCDSTDLRTVYRWRHSQLIFFRHVVWSIAACRKLKCTTLNCWIMANV